MYSDFINFVRSLYETSDIIALHEPCFRGNEKKYLNECIDSTFVSSVGKFVDLFEQRIAEYTGAKYAVAAVNGTAALHIALILSDVRSNDEVITQPLTFIATANAISYTGAKPVFIDVDKTTLGLSPDKLANFLSKQTYQGEEGFCYNSTTKKRIKACVPMHTFGHSVKIDEIKTICDKYNIVLIEDAAESIGSYYKEQHTGTFGLMGILSFNGNKTITTGGGGMIITDDKSLAKKAKHLTTTAKVPHKWNYEHNHIGYNYRLTNLAAAVGVAQLEQLPQFIQSKREIAKKYEAFFKNSEIQFFKEPENAKSNYWLNTIILRNKKERDSFLSYTNEHGVMTRPVWKLMNHIKMYKDCQTVNIENAEWLTDRLVNIPSSCV
jgi:aminotransferase in exopolysaccharide biosynthesis